MADRGRLFYDSNGKQRQVDPTASISGEPAEADLEPVEFVAITTDDLDITDISQGTEKILVDSVLSATQSAKVVTNFPGSISTTATPIFDFTAVGNNQLGGLLLVQGDGGGGDRFADVVCRVAGGSPTVLGSDEATSPAGRTYTADGNALDLEMASGTYEVGVVGLTVRAST